MHVNPPAEVSTSMKVSVQSSHPVTVQWSVLYYIDLSYEQKNSKINDQIGTKHVYCVTQVYQGHTLEKTYLGEDFFWAITPTAGDYILFKFDRPVSVER